MRTREKTQAAGNPPIELRLVGSKSHDNPQALTISSVKPILEPSAFVFRLPSSKNSYANTLQMNTIIPQHIITPCDQSILAKIKAVIIYN
jgi:hypothetical protein